MSNCPESNFDILFLLSISQKKYSELHLAELNILAYLSQLLSVYDSYRIDDWGYYFSYHSLGGPYSTEILNELNTLEENFTIKRLDTGNNYYSLKYPENINKLINKLLLFERFKWRKKYLNAAIDACLSKTLPRVTRAIRFEPGLLNATEMNRRQVLHKAESDNIYEYFKMLSHALGDIREDILIPASVWIDYLVLLSDKQQGEQDD